MTNRSSELIARLTEPKPLLLDGATGTELERHGVRSSLPLWSAHALYDAPDTLLEIHSAYVTAGAELITANTFRTGRRCLARAGKADHAAQLTALAVDLARQAASASASERQVFVLGSTPPLEDCYRPDLTPDDAALDSEHTEHARHLAEAGVDAILVETMNTIREAKAAVRAANTTALPVFVSFVCDGQARLLSGEALSDALHAVNEDNPAAVLVNCLPPSQVLRCLEVLEASPHPFGVYANLGEPIAESRSEDAPPEEFASHAVQWVKRGARIAGGCCGTTPAHIAAIASRLTRHQSRR
jgi:S-methylmethionine-dependent homocysteine/selenocysteine methylase